MRRIPLLVHRLTLDIAYATDAERLMIVRSVIGLGAPVFASGKGVSGMRPDLLIPNAMETHMIVFHGVETKQLVHYRKFCKERGQSYTEFLESNHTFLPKSPDGACNGA